MFKQTGGLGVEGTRKAWRALLLPLCCDLDPSGHVCLALRGSDTFSEQLWEAQSG